MPYERKTTRPHAMWDDSYYVKCYQLALSGMTNKKIASVLGIDWETLKRWIAKRPALEAALIEAREKSEENDSKIFEDYVYGQLPAKLRAVWDQITAADTEQNGISKIELYLQNFGKRTRQRMFFQALVHCNFNSSEACRMIGLESKTFISWCNDPDFAELFDEFHIHKKNFFEGALVRLVRQGDTTATIFANETINRDRGYSRKVDVNVTRRDETGQSLNDFLRRLPVELRKQILDHITDSHPTTPAAIENERAPTVRVDNDYESRADAIIAERKAESTRTES